MREFGKAENCLPIPGIEPRFLGRPARSLVNKSITYSANVFLRIAISRSRNHRLINSDTGQSPELLTYQLPIKNYTTSLPKNRRPPPPPINHVNFVNVRSLRDRHRHFWKVSPVVIATRPRDGRSGFRFLVLTRYFSLFLNAQTGSAAHLASYSVGSGVLPEDTTKASS